MQPHDHLVLREIRLSPGAEWPCSGDELLFIFPLSGKATFQLGQAEHPLGAGDALVVNATSARGSNLQAAPHAEFVFATLSLCLAHLFPLLDPHELAALQLVTDTLRTPRIHPAPSPAAIRCHRLLAELPTGLDLERRSGLVRLAAVLISREFASARAQHPSRGHSLDDQVGHAFEILSVGEIMDQSVKQLARRFHCSDRHLNRLFHQHFGLSVAALRMEMRLLKALSLLREPGERIANIAAACGFKQVNLFSRCFKRRFGLSPGQWRKQSPETSGNGSFAGAYSRHASSCQLSRIGLCPWIPQQLVGGGQRSVISSQ